MMQLIFCKGGRAFLPEEYYLKMSYRIAKFALEQDVFVEKGRNALRYCKDNYEKNSLFTREDLIQLERKQSYTQHYVSGIKTTVYTNGYLPQIIMNKYVKIILAGLTGGFIGEGVMGGLFMSPPVHSI